MISRCLRQACRDTPQQPHRSYREPIFVHANTGSQRIHRCFNSHSADEKVFAPLHRNLQGGLFMRLTPLARARPSPPPSPHPRRSYRRTRVPLRYRLLRQRSRRTCRMSLPATPSQAVTVTQMFRRLGQHRSRAQRSSATALQIRLFPTIRKGRTTIVRHSPLHPISTYR